MFGEALIRCSLAITLGTLIAACSPVATSQEAVPTSTSDIPGPVESARHPVSGLEIVEVAVISGSNRFTFKTELALSSQDQARGLMFRDALADDEAMLFPNDPPAMRSFWMKNTPIALDIIFIGPDRRITNIETAAPYSLDSVPSSDEVIAVFEIRGGLARELGIDAGDQVEWPVK